jgi:glutamate/tyrosine decarboxylase-like PLP-dependent enzyme
MRATELDRTLKSVDGPTIVCAQAGNVNSGAFDPLDEICLAARARNAWVHVDGAFGLWAAASARQHHVAGGGGPWATDAHKWLNVPYDCGLVIVADPAVQRACPDRAASISSRLQGGTRPL